MPIGIPPKGLEGDLEARWVVLASHQASRALRFDPGVLGTLISEWHPVPLAEQRRRGKLGEASMHRSQPGPKDPWSMGGQKWSPTGSFFLRLHLCNEIYCLGTGWGLTLGSVQPVEERVFVKQRFTGLCLTKRIGRSP